jgi:hypothetical protein
VDLNGAREGKNTATWTEREPADIVAFDIGDFGEVVPLGYPKIDARYTQGVVITDRDGNNYIDAPTTFYEAQLAAFGGQYNEFDVMSTNIEQTNHRFNNSALRIKAEDIQKYIGTTTAGADSAGVPSYSVDVVP